MRVMAFPHLTSILAQHSIGAGRKSALFGREMA